MSNHGIASGFTNEGRITPQNLIAGEFPRVGRIMTITGSGTLTAGAVLGKITADGHYCLSDAAATNGSEQPEAVLGEAIDLSAGNKQGLVYLTGEFNTQALSLGNGHSLASIAVILRARSIFLRDNQSV